MLKVLFVFVVLNIIIFFKNNRNVPKLWNGFDYKSSNTIRTYLKHIIVPDLVKEFKCVVLKLNTASGVRCCVGWQWLVTVKAETVESSHRFAALTLLFQQKSL